MVPNAPKLDRELLQILSQALPGSSIGIRVRRAPTLPLSHSEGQAVGIQPATRNQEPHHARSPYPAGPRGLGGRRLFPFQRTILEVASAENSKSRRIPSRDRHSPTFWRLPGEYRDAGISTEPHRRTTRAISRTQPLPGLGFRAAEYMGFKLSDTTDARLNRAVHCWAASFASSNSRHNNARVLERAGNAGAVWDS